jgi:hypothetical protein
MFVILLANVVIDSTTLISRDGNVGMIMKKFKQTRIYDNGGKTLDRYTFILPDNQMATSSEHGLGVAMFCGDWEGGSTRHLGKRIKREDLSRGVLTFLEYCES